jgi:translation initiation factor 4G
MFCNQHQFPKEMLLRLFIIFYNTELVDEDVFLQWKEDINETYAGKGKALFQVNNWLQWLETADEEDEEDADEEEG